MFGLQVDAYSGGNDRSTNGAVGTYIVPYEPNTYYIDPTTSLTGSHLVDITSYVEATFLKGRLIVQMRLPLYWRYSSHDAFILICSQGLTLCHGITEQALWAWRPNLPPRP
ncbi:hypothetical protein E3E12_02645 [Formicincola oecophyllae]|uniref:Uncharacterized protein n=1 Tax=Formicincola oecophyllae TaxID=2558361 RepID=A0A4Y6U7B0_9PROT|nr:hypothetical protein [Formicincola oecophyllae]QDH13283.2 hypothetical protein E3E12_02645 [Formicincola oecophyllae]